MLGTRSNFYVAVVNHMELQQESGTPTTSTRKAPSRGSNVGLLCL